MARTAKKPKKVLTREEARPLGNAVEKTFGVTLPPRLREFFDTGEYVEHHGSYVWDLPFYSGDSKMKLAFASKRLPDFLEYAISVFKVSAATHLPLAAAGDETYFVSVDTTDPALPVSFFDYESGFHRHAETFDEFLGRLLKKGEKTPVEKLEKVNESAKALYDEKKFAEAAALLEPAFASFRTRRTPVLLDEGKELIGAGLNLLGLCKDKLDDLPGALELFRKAWEEYGSSSAALNICDHFLNNTKEYEELVTYGEKLQSDIWKWVDEYAWYWVRLYLGYAFVVTGRDAKAVYAYHQILDAYAGTEPDKVARAVKDLKEEIVGGNLPNADIARRILTWMDVPPPALDAAEITANREWWGIVPPKVREKLLEAVKLEGKEPDDAALARIVRLTDLDFGDCEIKSLGFLSGFRRIDELDVEGNAITDLAPVSGMTTIHSLDVGKNKISSLVPVAGLTRIKSLDVSENGLSSLAGLEDMHELETLRANENKLTSIEPLAGLRSLKDATIYNNDIRDITPLASCPRLKEISCFGNDNLKKGLAAVAELPWLEDIEASSFPRTEKLAFAAKKPGIIEDDWGYDDDDQPPEVKRVITPEATATNRAWWESLSTAPAKARSKFLKIVKDAAEKHDEAENDQTPKNPSDACLAEALAEDSLHLDEAELTSLELLRPFTKADWLNVSENPVSDLTPLAGLTGLRQLLVREMQVESLEPLRALIHVEDLQCNDNRITSLAGIESMAGLRELTAQSNPLTDIGAVAGLTELRELFFEETAIASLEPLRKLTQLRRLWIYGTKITDLTPLAGCTSLEELICFSLPGLTGATALLDLPFLRQVTSHGSLPAAEVERFRNARPLIKID